MDDRHPQSRRRTLEALQFLVVLAAMLMLAAEAAAAECGADEYDDEDDCACSRHAEQAACPITSVCQVAPSSAVLCATELEYDPTEAPTTDAADVPSVEHRYTPRQLLRTAPKTSPPA